MCVGISTRFQYRESLMVFDVREIAICLGLVHVNVEDAVKKVDGFSEVRSVLMDGWWTIVWFEKRDVLTRM